MIGTRSTARVAAATLALVLAPTLALGLTIALALAPAAQAEQRPSPHCTGLRYVPGGERIFNGRNAAAANWPGLVALRVHNPATAKSYYYCGGVLVSDRWVLTAAHCVYRQFTKDATGYFQNLETDVHPVLAEDLRALRFGDTGRLEVAAAAPAARGAAMDLEDAGKLRVAPVAAIEIHPGYDRPDKHVNWYGGFEQRPDVTGHDVALLRLAGPLPGPRLPLSLSPDTDPPDAYPVPAMVAGFGRTDPLTESNNPSLDTAILPSGLRAFPRSRPTTIAATRFLQETDLPTTPAQACRAANPQAAVGPGQICAADPRAKSDSCSGDSGGPLVVFDAQRCPYVVGLTSWGRPGGDKPCAVANTVPVYTRVSHHAKWIRDTVGDVGAVTPASVAVTRSQVESGEKSFEDGLARLLPVTGASVGRLNVGLCSLASLRDGAACAARDTAALTHRSNLVADVTSPVAGELHLFLVTRFDYSLRLVPFRDGRPALLRAGETLRLPNDLVPGSPGFSTSGQSLPSGMSAAERRQTSELLAFNGGKLIALVTPASTRVSARLAGREYFFRRGGLLTALAGELESGLRSGQLKPADIAFATIDLDVRY